LRQTVDDCDTKIGNYRAALDAGGDATLIAGWIKETTTILSATQAMLGARPTRPERTNCCPHGRPERSSRTSTQNAR